MSKSRIPRWVSFPLMGLGLLVVFIPSLFLYMAATAKKVHPVAENIPSVTHATPLAPWASPVERARRLTVASLAEENIAGLSVAVGMNGEIVWAEGFGFADVEKSIPVEPDDKFRIGSAAIPLTSAAVGLLVDEGKVKFDDEIQAHVLDFPQKQWPMTVRQVMGHIGGVHGEDPDNGVLTTGHCDKTSDAVKRFAKDDLSGQPGTEFQFSVFGWVLLSAVVEDAAEKPFTEFMQDRVFRPLGMNDTVKDATPDPIPGEVPLYYPRFRADPKYGLDPFHRFDYSCFAGSAGYLSTPSDLVRFGMAINSGKLVKPETVKLMQTSQKLASGAETGYGLGWQVKNVALAGKQVLAAGHDGDIFFGHVATLLTFPDTGLTVAVTSNTAFANTDALAEKIAQEFQ